MMSEMNIGLMFFLSLLRRVYAIIFFYLTFLFHSKMNTRLLETLSVVLVDF